MKWISSNDIRQWPVKAARECQGKAPILLRKLLQASTSKLSNVDIPGDDAVAVGGFDGYFELGEDLTYLKKGKYVVEVGTDHGIGKKAETDYQSSFTKVIKEQPNDVTYIFFTPRLFSKADSWIIEKKKGKSYWKDIIVINATIIEQWVELCPPVATWLAIDMKLVFGHKGIISLDQWWQRKFVKPDGFRIEMEVPLTERESSSIKLTSYIDEATSIINVESSSSFESMAFCVATLNKEKGRYDKACIVANDDLLWDSGLYQSKYIFITSECSLQAMNHAIKEGHKVIFCKSVDQNTKTTHVIRLQSPQRYALAKSIEKSGLTWEESTRLSGESFSELEILSHILEFDECQFYWDNTTDLQVLKWAALLGCWNSSIQGDKTIIELLTDLKYEEYTSKLQTYVNRERSPIICIRDTYKIKYHGLINNSLTKHGIGFGIAEVKSLFEAVFIEANPILDLEPMQRPWAKFRGLQPNTSSGLKKGMLNSLIHFSQNPKSFITQKQIDEVIDAILVNSTSKVLKTNSRLLQFYAEASPKSFLQFLTNTLAKEDEVVMKLFEEEKGMFMPASYHTDLLRALESLAWFPEYYEDSISCLFKLAKLDPGGALSNRPINSLKNVNSLWLQYTNVSQEHRFLVFERLAKEYPNLIVDVLCSILGPRTIMSTATFQYRHEIRGELKINPSLALEETFKIFERVKLDLTENSWISILQFSMEIPSDYKKRALKLIREAASTQIYFSELVHAIGRYYVAYSGSSKKDSEEYCIELYRDTYIDLTAIYSDIEIEAAYLAHNNYLLESDLNLDYVKRQEANQSLRVSLLKKKLDNSLEKACQLLSKIDQKRLYGADINEVLSKDQHLPFLRYCLSEMKFHEVAMGFCHELKHLEGKKALNELYVEIKRAKPISDAAAIILATQDNSMELWTDIEKEGSSFESIYWRYMNYYQSPQDVDSFKYMIEKLKQHRSNADLSWLVYRNKSTLDAQYLIDFLIYFGTENIKLLQSQMGGHHLTDIIDEVYDRNLGELEDLMLNVEFLYFDIITSSHYSSKFPSILEKTLSTDANFTSDLLLWAKDHTDNPDRAIKCWKVLNEFKKSTLLINDDQPKVKEYVFWANDLLKIASSKDVQKSAERLIGELIGLYPKSENWPEDWICSLVLSFDNEEIERSFISASSLGKGTKANITGRGGREARAKRKYEEFTGYAKRVQFTFPKISKMLGIVAQNYYMRIENYRQIEREEDLKD